MDVQIDPRIQSDPALLAMVQAAQDDLEWRLGPAKPVTQITWTLAGRSGDAGAVRVEVVADGARAEKVVTLSELKNKAGREWRMFEVWDDVLRERFARKMERVTQSLATAEPE